MRYAEAFRNGFDLMKRNWQLVAIKLAAVVVNIFLLLFLVVLPLIIAVVMMGIDSSFLAELENIHFSSLLDHVARYFLLIMVGLIFFTVYLSVVTVIAIFLFGASSGIIALSVREPASRFSSRLFFSEGKRLFGPFFRYITVYSLLLIPVIIVMVVVIVAGFAIVHALSGSYETLAVGIGIFLALSITAIFLFIGTASLAVFFYGSAHVVFKGEKSLASIRESVAYLYKNPSAYWLYCLLLICSIGLTAVLVIVGIPLNLIPFFGPLIAIPYQVLSSIVQTFFGYFITAAVFLYFFRTGMVSAAQATGQNYTSPSEASRPPSSLGG